MHASGCPQHACVLESESAPALRQGQHSNSAGRSRFQKAESESALGLGRLDDPAATRREVMLWNANSDCGESSGGVESLR